MSWREEIFSLSLVRASECSDRSWRKQMRTRLKIFAATAILSMMIATPVFAQAAVQEPGLYAFYHPDGDVLEANRRWPHKPAGAMASVPAGNDAYASMDSNRNKSLCAGRYRSYDPASGTFLGYDGARHPCR
jgi:BA14K-like protein